MPATVNKRISCETQSPAKAKQSQGLGKSYEAQPLLSTLVKSAVYSARAWTAAKLQPKLSRRKAKGIGDITKHNPTTKDNPKPIPAQTKNWIEPNTKPQRN